MRYQVLAVRLARALDAKKHQRELIEPHFRQVSRDAKRADPFVRWLLQAAHAWLIAQELQRARRYTIAGGALVIAGAVLFFSVTGSGSPKYVPVLTPQVTVAPSATATHSPATSGTLGDGS